ncbi:MAG TPA: hypothetical protein VN929_05035 [Burkholderiales bacterium]|nr:hypothetical protein [Burkholderiales bacterium]
MNKKAFAVLLVAAPPFLAMPAYAVPNIENLAIKPSGGAPAEVEIAVSIHRPTPLDLSCDAILQTGDGSQPQRLEYGLGDRRTKIVKYTYKKAGTYRVKVSGTGDHACKGAREAQVKVATTARTAQANGKSPAKPKCPRGWTLAVDSYQGDRYTCRADPPAQALKCSGATQYFAEKGEIGCR